MSDHGPQLAIDDESPVPSSEVARAWLVEILPNQFGYLVTGGKRSKDVLYEGLHLQIPFLQVIERWSKDFGADPPFEVRFTSKPTVTIDPATGAETPGGLSTESHHLPPVAPGRDDRRCVRRPEGTRRLCHQ